MIARQWHGRIPKDKAEAYHSYLLKTGLKDYEQTPGNRGVYLMKREEADCVHIYTLSFWEDYEAIRQFAGEDVEKARYYEEDRDYLLEFEPFVTHFEVLEFPGAPER